MTRHGWMRNLESLSRKARKPRRPRRGPVLALEALEDRLAPALTWTALGPAPITNGQTAPSPNGLAVSGRVTGIAADPSDANTLFLASAGGGVWKTTNGGTSWSPLTDNLTNNGTPVPIFMGAVAETRDGSSNQIVYAGTGEANNSGDSFYGTGILVSRDGGATWTLTTAAGAFNRQAVSKIAIDPSDPTGATAYAAVAAFDTGVGTRNTGIWKTTNFGATWTNTTATLANLPTQNAWSDVVVDPNTPTTVYAAEGSQQTSGGFGTGNGVYKTTNGGSSWSQLTGTGSFNGTQDGRIALALFDNGTTQELFVSIAVPVNQVGGGNLFKFLESSNGGSTFSDLTSHLSDYLSGQGWYDTTLAVDPSDPNYVYAAGVMSQQGPTFAGSPLESFDGGTTWRSIGTDPANNGPHTDAHAVAFDAAGNLLDGDDGGIFKLSNPNNASTQRWSSLNTNLGTIQFYGIAVDPTDATVAYGGSQDNGTEKYTGTASWTRIQSGDGAITRVDPTNHLRVYSEFNGKSLQRSDNGGTSFVQITAGAQGTSGNFYLPYVLDAAGDIYYGTNNLNFSSTQGTGWATPIGQPGVHNFNTNGASIDAIAVSPATSNVVYVAAGSNLYVTTNAQAGGSSVTWTAIDLPNLFNAGSELNSLAVDPSDATGGTAYEVVNRFSGGGKHVFKTTNFGSTWTDISGSLPDTPAWSVAVSPNGAAVYVGTDVGVYSTTNGGTTWSPFGAGLPNAQVDELEYVAALNLLAAGTHGRGLWEVTILPPTANSQSVTVPANTPTQITLTGSAPGGDAFTFQLTSSPAQGTLSNFNAATGAVTYTPNTNFFGPDSFTFTVTDTATGLVSGSATESITVAGGFTLDWNGSLSNDWFNAQNWTDANDGTHHAVPGTADTAVIVASSNDPTLTAGTTIAGLQVNGGTLTLGGTLTDSGAFAQSGGAVNLNSFTLQVAGNVTRTGGSTPGTAGAVELNGTAGQAFLDTSFNKLPGLLISNTSAAGVTLPGGSNVGVRTGGGGVTLNAGATLTLLQGSAASFLIDRGDFIDNGKIVLTQFSPNGGGSTALITINGTLALGGTSAFDLTVGKLTANAVYTFVTYAATTGTAGATTVHGGSVFGAATAFGAIALTVALSSPGTIDTWTGAVSNDWFTAANWTAADGSHVVPGASDLAVIKGAPFATVLNANATVAGLQFSNGFLTLNANLTVTGAFSPDSGFIAFGSNADQLILDGDVTRKSGTFLGTAGTVVFGGANQSVTDMSGRAFGWNVVVNSGAAVTEQAGSVVRVGNNFTDNGTVNLTVSAPGNATAPLMVGGTATLGSGSTLNLAMGAPASGVTYLFIQFGMLVDNGVVFGFSGQGGFTPTAHKNPNSLTVTLA